METVHASRTESSREPFIVVALFELCVIWELLQMVQIPPFAGNWTLGIRMAELFLLGRISRMISIRENKWILIPHLGILLIFLLSAFRDHEVMERTYISLGRSLLAYGLCPAVGLLLSEDQLKRFLQVFIAVWTIFYLSLCLVGLYCAVHGIAIRNAAEDWEIGLSIGVLRLADHQNTTGPYLAIAVAVALVGAVLSKKKIIRALYLVSCLPMLLASSLTRCRISFVVSALAMGLTVAALLQNPMERKISSKALQVILSVLMVLCIAVPAVIGIYASHTLFNQYVSGSLSNPLISTARAESEIITQDTIIPVGDMNLLMKYGSFFSGREYGWEAAVQLLTEQPILLLTGTSIPLVMEQISMVSSTGLAHLHSMYLQILVETGIWGAALMLIYLCLFIPAAWRLFFGKEVSPWKRCVPIPAMVILVMELLESITRLTNRNLHATIILMLFSSITMILGRKKPA